MFDVDPLSPSFGSEIATFSAPGSSFGSMSAVAIDGDLAVAAFPDGGASGKAFLFEVNTGKTLFMLTAPEVRSSDDFGVSVSIFGDRFIVGSRFDDTAGLDSGAAYVFDAFDGSFLLKLTAGDASPDDSFGISVGIRDNVAVVGANRVMISGERAGAAYLYNAVPEPHAVCLFAIGALLACSARHRHARSAPAKCLFERGPRFHR